MVERRTQEYPAVYLQCAGCSGCAVSLLNAVSPSIKNLLVDEVIPGKHVNLRFLPTIMAAAGEIAMEVLDEAEQMEQGFLLIVEGAVPTQEGYGAVGERGGRPEPMLDRILSLSQNALAIIALGTCAAFGGIPAARPNPSGCISVREALARANITTPLINVPGCPPQPDWFAGTVASILLQGLPGPDALDEHLRPKLFYGQLIHENCPRRAWFDEGKFAKRLGDEGCLYELGCKGPITHADCPTRHWNGGVNWVIGAGAPCNGCVEPGFPDLVSPFYAKLQDVAIPRIGECWKEQP
jgi:hydrogenase small subunit